MKPDSQKKIPFGGHKKYFDQSKEMMTPIKNFHSAEGWQYDKYVIAVCGPGWVRTHLKHYFPDLTYDESLMNFDEKENDTFLLSLVLMNLSKICFFPQDAETAEDCVNADIIYYNAE